MVLWFGFMAWLFVSLAIMIIIGLASYAAYLLIKLKKHKAIIAQRQEQAILEGEQQWRQQQLELIKDIKFLSNSVLQDQCEITEGVLRLQYNINRLDPELWVVNELTVLREFYDQVKGMPILDDYKALNKRDRMKLDKERWDLELKHKQDVFVSLKWILTYDFPRITRLH